MFQPEVREDLKYWVETDWRTTLRLLELVEAIVREPFSCIGKPEPLKHLGPNLWSRRLTQEHRVVYLVRDDRIDLLQGRYHYWSPRQPGWEESQYVRFVARVYSEGCGPSPRWIVANGEPNPSQDSSFGVNQRPLRAAASTAAEFPKSNLPVEAS